MEVHFLMSNVEELSIQSVKLWLYNHKRADFLASKFWIFFHFAASLSPGKMSNLMLFFKGENAGYAE